MQSETPPVLHRVRSVWHTLTSPISSNTTPEERQQIQFVTSRLWIITAVAWGVVLLHLLTGAMFAVDFAAASLLTAITIYSRSQPQHGSVLAVTTISIMALVSAVVQMDAGQPAAQYSVLPWLMLSVTLGYVLFAFDGVTYTVGANLVALIFVDLVLTDYSLTDNLEIYVAHSIFILVTAHLRAGHMRQLAERTDDLEQASDHNQIISELVSDYAFFIRLNPPDVEVIWSIGQPRVFGYDPAHLLNSQGQHIHPDDAHLLEAHIERLQRGLTSEFEARIYAKNGQLRWMNALVQPVGAADENGIHELYGVFRDVTARREAEEILKKRESEFRALVENSPDVILRFDRDLRCIYANPTFLHLMKRSAEDFIGKTQQDFGVPVQLANRINNAISTVFERKSEVRIEYDHHVGDVSYAVEARIVPEFADENHDNVDTALFIGRDISARRLQEELQMQYNQADILQRFMREAAHDLITPLTTMKTNLYLMQRTTEDPAHLRRIELLEDQTDHIQKSMNALLKMTRLDSSNFDFEETDLNQLVRNMVLSQQVLMEVKGQQVKFKPDERLERVFVDQGEVQFVIRELLMNAMAHSTAGATTYVETHLGQDEVMISVKDEGDGIAPNDLIHIFEPFYRAAAREIVKGGIGLGLTLSRLIIDAHGGRIEVQSKREKGSTFFVYLPIIKDQNELRKKRTTQQFQIPGN